MVEVFTSGIHDGFCSRTEEVEEKGLSPMNGDRLANPRTEEGSISGDAPNEGCRPRKESGVQPSMAFADL